jgi:transcriptional regulator with XRE-family HTH domain
MPGTIIRHYREMKNYSQKWVASQMGISQNAYSKIENNITQLTVHHVRQLSKILEVPVLDLLKDDFEIHRPTTLPKTVTKEQLLEHVKMLQQKLSSKHVTKHDAYLVALSLVIAAENTVDSVH